VIPDALIRVWLGGDGPEITTNSDSEGKFYVPLLKSATYKFEVSRFGFKPYRIDTLTMSRNEQVDLNVILEPDKCEGYDRGCS
jgi:hypothetical protein